MNIIAALTAATVVIYVAITPTGRYRISDLPVIRESPMTGCVPATATYYADLIRPIPFCVPGRKTLPILIPGQGSNFRVKDEREGQIFNSFVNLFSFSSIP